MRWKIFVLCIIGSLIHAMEKAPLIHREPDDVIARLSECLAEGYAVVDELNTQFAGAHVAGPIGYDRRPLDRVQSQAPGLMLSVCSAALLAVGAVPRRVRRRVFGSHERFERLVEARGYLAGALVLGLVVTVIGYKTDWFERAGRGMRDAADECWVYVRGEPGEPDLVARLHASFAERPVTQAQLRECLAELARRIETTCKRFVEDCLHEKDVQIAALSSQMQVLLVKCEGIQRVFVGYKEHQEIALAEIEEFSRQIKSLQEQMSRIRSVQEGTRRALRSFGLSPAPAEEPASARL